MEDEIRNVIFPLCVVDNQETNYAYRYLAGTGFILGSNGFAMTARHVIQNIALEQLCGLLNINKQWNLIFFENIKHHPSEDVSILKIKGVEIKSFIYPSQNFENASCPYQLWGYPEFNSSFFYKNQCGITTFAHRPELCYYEGHIVRRLSNAEEFFIGKNWCNVYEIPPGFKGCSGAPLIKKAPRNNNAKWEMLGIYVGNKPNRPKSFLGFLKESDALEYQNIVNNKEYKNLIDIFDSYMQECAADIAGFAIREDSIRIWLKEIDSSLYDINL